MLKCSAAAGLGSCVEFDTPATLTNCLVSSPAELLMDSDSHSSTLGSCISRHPRQAFCVSLLSKHSEYHDRAVKLLVTLVKKQLRNVVNYL